VRGVCARTSDGVRRSGYVDLAMSAAGPQLPKPGENIAHREDFDRLN
jgi:hypothetical protein